MYRTFGIKPLKISLNITDYTYYPHIVFIWHYIHHKYASSFSVHYLPIGVMEAVLGMNWKGDQISRMFATIMFRTFLICRLSSGSTIIKQNTRRAGACST